jgi:hypothetical protein
MANLNFLRNEGEVSLSFWAALPTTTLPVNSRGIQSDLYVRSNFFLENSAPFANASDVYIVGRGGNAHVSFVNNRYLPPSSSLSSSSSASAVSVGCRSLVPAGLSIKETQQHMELHHQQQQLMKEEADLFYHQPQLYMLGMDLAFRPSDNQSQALPTIDLALNPLR